MAYHLVVAVDGVTAVVSVLLVVSVLNVLAVAGGVRPIDPLLSAVDTDRLVDAVVLDSLLLAHERADRNVLATEEAADLVVVATDWRGEAGVC